MPPGKICLKIFCNFSLKIFEGSTRGVGSEQTKCHSPPPGKIAQTVFTLATSMAIILEPRPHLIHHHHHHHHHSLSRGIIKGDVTIPLYFGHITGCHFLPWAENMQGVGGPTVFLLWQREAILVVTEMGYITGRVVTEGHISGHHFLQSPGTTGISRTGSSEA